MLEEKYGSDIYKVDKSIDTPESIMKKIEHSIKYRNVGFKVDDLLIESDGNVLYVSKVDAEKDWICTTLHSNLILESSEQLVDLILDYSEEKISQLQEGKPLYKDLIKRLHDFNMKSFYDGINFK